MDTAGDIGTVKSELSKAYSNFDFSLVGREKWWKTKAPESQERLEREL